MSCATTHEVRSHRSKRTWKPVNKTMRNKEATQRKKLHKFLGLSRLLGRR